MRLAILLTGAILLAGSLWYLDSRRIGQADTMQPKSEKEEEYAIQEYEFSFWGPADANKTNIIPNFDEKLKSEELTEKYECLSGINGGFYTENHKPLGLFISDRKETGKYKTSDLLNGVIGVTGGKGTIHRAGTLPEGEYKWAVQTGPLLALKGEYFTLSMARDKPARRMVGAVNQSGSLIFIAIYVKDSALDGPMLSGLPELVKGIDEQQDLKIISAINLDGGGASAWYNEGVRLLEFNPVGSWVCLKE